MLAALDQRMVRRVHVALVDLYIPIVDRDGERLDTHHLLRRRHQSTSKYRIAFWTVTSLPTLQYAYRPRSPRGYLEVAPKT